MTVLLIGAIVLATATLVMFVLGLLDMARTGREERRLAERAAIVLLAQQRIRMVTRATLEAMRDADRTGLPSQGRKWSGQ